MTTPAPEPGDAAASADAIKERIFSVIRRERIDDLPIEKLHANPWNPNVQDERTFIATRESIREFGFIDPVTVWPHPEVKGEFMCIDGEHRWRAAIEEGLTVVDVTVLHDLTEAQAKKLTIILNETRGDADVTLLGKLLADIEMLVGPDDIDLMTHGLPYNEHELRHLLDIGSTDWDGFNNTYEPPAQRHANRKFTVFVEFDQAQRERYDAFMGILAHELGDAFTVEEAILSSLSGACQNL